MQLLLNSPNGAQKVFRIPRRACPGALCLETFPDPQVSGAFPSPEAILKARSLHVALFYFIFSRECSSQGCEL